MSASGFSRIGQNEAVIGCRQTGRFPLPALFFEAPLSTHLVRLGGGEVLPDAAAEQNDPNALPRRVRFEKGLGNQRFAPAPSEEALVEAKSL